MNLEINLTGVEAASEQQSTGRKFMKPGPQTLTISKIEVTEAKSGNKGLAITFDSKENESSFIEKFWLSEGALPRLQYLIEKFTGAKHEGKISVEGLSAKLVGKSQPCIVDGREALKTVEEDGVTKTYVNVYPQLRFAGFVGEFTDADVIIIELPADQKPGTAPSTGEDKKDDFPF